MEDSKLVVEFMGGNLRSDRVVWLPFHGLCDLGTTTGKILRYNTSWDWLMPVVAKCYNIDFDADDVEMSNLIGDISCAVLNIDIQETYEACVELIKYLNSK